MAYNKAISASDPQAMEKLPDNLKECKESHQNGAYQRQLNSNAIWAANHLSILKPTDGRTVREHQPKAPARDDGAR